MRPPLPPGLVETARAYAAGTRTPVEPRDAATVVLMRPSAAGPEVYLLRRQTSMAFAGGMCVFPGGGVDSRDFDADVAWAGPSVSAWASWLGTDEALARALVCAAVRETFEESGVLLAGPSGDEVVADTTGDGWEADRVALEGRTLSLTELLARRALVLRTDLLGVWTAWTTPLFEPRRFRTWFFVADLPSGQRTRDVSSESDVVAWMPALEAVERVEAGSIGMFPPTYFTCLELSTYADPAAVIAAAQGRSVEMFTPQLVEENGGWTLSTPASLEALLAARGRP